MLYVARLCHGLCGWILDSYCIDLGSVLRDFRVKFVADEVMLKMVFLFVYRMSHE
jgi:hypothetical protein